MTGAFIWLGAAALYGAFRLWYDGWRGPLRPDEVERYLAALDGTPGAEVNDLAVLRRFFEADDGREFYMLNLVKLAPGEVPHPTTVAPVRAAQLLQEYIRGFLSVLVRHAGHPATRFAASSGAGRSIALRMTLVASLRADPCANAPTQPQDRS